MCESFKNQIQTQISRGFRFRLEGRTIEDWCFGFWSMGWFYLDSKVEPLREQSIRYVIRECARDITWILNPIPGIQFEFVEFELAHISSGALFLSSLNVFILFREKPKTINSKTFGTKFDTIFIMHYKNLLVKIFDFTWMVTSLNVSCLNIQLI